MRAGFHASSLLLHDEVALVGELAAMGYQSVAVRPRCGSLDPNDDRFPVQMARLEAASGKHDTTLIIDSAGAFIADPNEFHGPSLAAKSAEEAELAETWIAKWIDLADEFSAPVVTFSSGSAGGEPSIPGSDEPILDRLAARTNRLINRARAAGVQLALRPALGDAIPSIAGFERFSQWIDEADTLYLAADVSEMLIGGEFPVAFRLSGNMSRLACVYLCEREADRARDQIPSNCEIDLHRIVQSLRKLRYSGPAIARVDGHSEWGLSLARDALEWFADET